MTTIRLTEGRGRTSIKFQSEIFGSALIVRIFNANPHLGAVAVGEFDETHQRPSVSVLTRLGHKDDALAQSAAHDISKATRKPVCVIVGVHLDDVTLEEIRLLEENTHKLVKRFLENFIFDSEKT